MNLFMHIRNLVSCTSYPLPSSVLALPMKQEVCIVLLEYLFNIILVAKESNQVANFCEFGVCEISGENGRFCLSNFMFLAIGCQQIESIKISRGC